MDSFGPRFPCLGPAPWHTCRLEGHGHTEMRPRRPNLSLSRAALYTLGFHQLVSIALPDPLPQTHCPLCPEALTLRSRADILGYRTGLKAQALLRTWTPDPNLPESPAQGFNSSSNPLQVKAHFAEVLTYILSTPMNRSWQPLLCLPSLRLLHLPNES